MDEIRRAHYELKFEVEFLRRRGNEFQELFCLVMENGYPNDFIRTRPWGKQGDRKNDGYLPSQRRLFQVYAPNELSSAETVSKITEDFNGAIPHWKQYFDNWCFVHNAREGLPPDVTKKLLELQSQNHGFSLTHFGFVELRTELFKCTPNGIASILGNAPSAENLLSLSFEKLKPVIEAIGQREPNPGADIRPVPQNKLTHNKLSSNVETLLRAGMRKSDLVGEFFEKWHDAGLGDRIANSFTERYEALKRSQVGPDLIFDELHRFAGGSARGSSDDEAAVLAVLAYFFEECDIFEAPPGGTP